MKNIINKISRTIFGYGLIICAVVLFDTAAFGANYTVNNNNDSGAGSLRQAILDANATTGVADTIQVSIGNATINLLTPLSVITDTVTIINMDVGSGRVELNGLATRNGATPSIGFDIQAPNCQIRGFAVNRFGDGGIRVNIGGNGTIIHQNYIGTNAAGDSVNCPVAANPCGNINYGIWVRGATGVQIGTSGPSGLPNTISGNLGRGITISGATVGINFFNGSAIVANNFIGTEGTSGNNDLGNQSDGILIAGASGSQIGNTNPVASRNVISGNNGNGINIVADFNLPASNNVVQGNYIGYSFSGGAIPNNGSGVVIAGANNIVGGTTADARNVISGNKANGVSLTTNFATGNVVAGNFIGTNQLGTGNIGNVLNGIQISNSASGNTIGGTDTTPGQCNNSCNIIANNGDTLGQTARGGIYIDATGGAGNRIRGNSIFNNVGIGIDLQATGTTANDTSDGDTGANNQQNKPVITGANDLEFISGTLNSTPSTVFAIDFFVNSTPDTIATSEGRTYLGTATTTTNASGNASFNFSTTVPLSVGQFVTATATATGAAFAPQSVGDSSEHSDAVAVINQPTAALVEVSGRVLTADGRGISRVIVFITDTNGRMLRARTNAFGYYRFDEVPAGETYTITASHKRYQFTPRVVSINESVNNLDFTAEP